MLLSVPHHQQVHRKNCLPACVQMVLEYQGVKLSQSDIEALLQTEAEGTRLHNVDLLLPLHFVESITLARLSLDQLEASVSDGFPQSHTSGRLL